MRTIALCAISALLIGCAAPQPTSSTRSPTTARKSAPKKIDEEDKPPFIGMTKAQALARFYGEPKKRTVTDEGEQWT